MWNYLRILEHLNHFSSLFYAFFDKWVYDWFNGKIILYSWTKNILLFLYEFRHFTSFFFFPFNHCRLRDELTNWLNGSGKLNRTPQYSKNIPFFQSHEWYCFEVFFLVESFEVWIHWFTNDKERKIRRSFWSRKLGEYGRTCDNNLCSPTTWERVGYFNSLVTLSLFYF